MRSHVKFEAHVGRKVYCTVDDYIADCKEVFKPNMHAYREAVKGTRQKKE